MEGAPLCGLCGVHGGVWASFSLWDPSFPPLEPDRHPPTISKTEGHTCRCSRLKIPVWLAMEYQPARARASSYAGTEYYLNISSEYMAGICDIANMSAESHWVLLIIGWLCSMSMHACWKQGH